MTNIAIRIHAFLAGLVADLREERGQDLLEYALIGGAMAAAILAAFFILDNTNAVDSMVTNIANCVDFEPSTCNIDTACDWLTHRSSMTSYCFH